MGIFNRIGDLIKSNVNDLIDKAEDPQKMVKQIIIDMEEQLAKTTQAMGQAMASERQVKKQLDTAREQSKSWEEKAKMALNSGNQELAKQALANKVKSDGMVKQYGEMDAKLEAQLNTIKQQVETLKSKLEEARSRQSLLVARAQMADTQKDMAKNLGNIDSSSAFAKMDKMERKIEQKEAEAEAFSEVAGVTEAEDSFEKMEKDQAVDAELQRLMAEMNKENK